MLLKKNTCHTHLSSLLWNYAFYGWAPFCMPSWVLVLEFMQQSTNLLAWIGSASFNQFVLVGVWHSCFQVYFNLLDLLPSIVRVFHINFCLVEIYLPRENNYYEILLCSVACHIDCVDVPKHIFLDKRCMLQIMLVN